MLKIKNKQKSNATASIGHLFRFDIGSIISIFLAVPIAKLHYRTVVKEKTLLLKENTGIFVKKTRDISNRGLKLVVINYPLLHDLQKLHVLLTQMQVNLDGEQLTEKILLENFNLRKARCN